MSDLYKECINALEVVTILDESSSDSLSEKMFNSFEFDDASTVDWRTYPDHQKVDDFEYLIQRNGNLDCYVLWDNAEYLGIRTNLKSVLNKVDDVTAVSFDTWVIGLEFDWILEFHNEGLVRFTDNCNK